MRFVKDTLSFIFQVLLIIFVNLFVADITISYIYVSFIAILTRYDTVSILGIDVKCVDIYIILLMVITILKYISLPILYNILYKISKNKIILGFIHLLKTNILFKIFILFLALAPGFLLILIYNPEIDLVLYLYIYIWVSSAAIFFCFSGGRLKSGGRVIVINGIVLKELKIHNYI
ncbi:MAG: hypothetical protein MRZ90_00105 [Candidatus Gastranaerophilales bacterium]|nr:hypothetical protein [Candidatus Gastranaerophilales bacterium]